MFCTNCGAQVEDGAVFCTNCGTRLEAAANAASEVKTENVQAEVNADTVVSEASPEPVYDVPENISEDRSGGYEQADPAGSPSGETPKKKIGLLIGIIAGAAVLIAAIILLCVFVIFKNDDSSSKKNKADTEESSDDEEDDDKKSSKKKKKSDSDKDDEDDEDTAKKTKKKKKDDNDKPAEPDDTDETKPASYDTDVYQQFGALLPVSSEARSMMSTIQSDYGSINWTDEFEIAGSGLVLSVAKFQSGDEAVYAYCLTNVLDDTTLDLYGSVSALSSSDMSVGDGYFNNSALSPGSQEIGILFCDGEPSGDFKVDVSARESTKEEGTWTSDWSAEKSSYSLTFNYDLHNNLEMTYEAGDIYCFALDSSGNILGYGYDYPLIAIDPGKSYSGEVTIYVSDGGVDQTSAVAMFVETELISDDDKFLDSDGTGYFESDNNDQLYIIDNGDGTCSLYLKVMNGKSKIEYIDLTAEMHSGYIDFSNVDTGEYVGSVSFYGDTAYVYIGSSGQDADVLEDGSNFELTKGTASSKDVKGFVSAIDKKR